jgi:hypothetical protein
MYAFKKMLPAPKQHEQYQAPTLKHLDMAILLQLHKAGNLKAISEEKCKNGTYS